MLPPLPPHMDAFIVQDDPAACACNSESLSHLNGYVDALSRDEAVQPATLMFYIKEADGLVPLEAVLPKHGSLGPLFYAFGLITEDELSSGVGQVGQAPADADNIDFLHWLSRTAQEAIVAAQSHESRKIQIQAERQAIVETHALSSLELGTEFAVTTAEQERQLETLAALRASLPLLEEAILLEKEMVRKERGELTRESREEAERDRDQEGGTPETKSSSSSSSPARDVLERRGRRRWRRTKKEREEEARLVAEAEAEAYVMSSWRDPKSPLTGLGLRVYHPAVAPVGLTDHRIAEDGVVHVVADADPVVLVQRLRAIEFDKAMALTNVHAYWRRRCGELLEPIRQATGVQNVWCDSHIDTDLQKIVLWAGLVLQHIRQQTERDQQRSYADGQMDHDLEDLEHHHQSSPRVLHPNPPNRLSFSMLVHADESGPMLDFLAASSVLQVRADCPPQRLLEFLLSEDAGVASTKTAAAREARADEEDALERARVALDAKHVIRVSASADERAIADAARRLEAAAPRLMAAGVDLRGASIAIDDCYELWESGFVSIPHDFRDEDMTQQIARLLIGSGEHYTNTTTIYNGGGASTTHADDNGVGYPSSGSPERLGSTTPFAVYPVRVPVLFTMMGRLRRPTTLVPRRLGFVSTMGGRAVVPF